MLIQWIINSEWRRFQVQHFDHCIHLWYFRKQMPQKLRWTKYDEVGKLQKAAAFFSVLSWFLSQPMSTARGRVSGSTTKALCSRAAGLTIDGWGGSRWVASKAYEVRGKKLGETCGNMKCCIYTPCVLEVSLVPKYFWRVSESLTDMLKWSPPRKRRFFHIFSRLGSNGSLPDTNMAPAGVPASSYASWGNRLWKPWGNKESWMPS